MVNTVNKKGFGLVEIVIVTAIVTLSLAGFLQAGIIAIRLLQAEKETLEASLLAEEAVEAIRALRDESWANNIATLTTGVTYYPIIENGKWKFSTYDPGVINGKYRRTVVLNGVFRNASDQIASSGTSDSGTLKVTSTVTWGGKTSTLTTYITDFASLLSPATESKVISYEGASTDTNFAKFPSNNLGDGDPEQSFTTLASSIQVTKIELYLHHIASTTPSNVYAELRTSPAGTVLGTANEISGNSIATTSLSWVEFRFATPITLSPSTLYYIRLRSDPASTDAGSGSLGQINWGYLQTAGSPYAGGDARLGVGKLSNPLDTGTLQNQYDFGFRIYVLQ